MDAWRSRVAVVAGVTLCVDWTSKIGAVDPQANDAYALGSLSGPGVLLALVSITLLAAIAVYTGRRHQRYHASGVGMLVGGGLANALERLFSGAVTDFIVVGSVVANLADAAIVLGIAMLTTDYVRAARAVDL